MSNEYPSFKSFSAGEISPRMFARSDMAMYHHALAKCENFVLTPQGSIIMRRGWHFMRAQDQNAYSRLFTFPRSLGEDIVIGIREGQIVAFTDSVEYPVDLGSDPAVEIPQELELLTNGDLSNGTTGWTVQQNELQYPFPTHGTIVGGEYLSASAASLQGPNNSFHTDRLVQYITYPTGKLYDPDMHVTFDMDFNSANFPPLPPASGSTVPIIPPTQGWNFQVRETSDFPFIGDSGAKPISPTYIEGSDLGNINVGNVAPNQVVGEYVAFGAKTEVNYAVQPNQYYAAQIVNMSIKMYAYALPPTGPSTVPWTEAQIKALHFQTGLDSNACILTNREVPPQQLVFDEDTSRFRLSRFYPVGIENSWTDETGYPATSEVFQGRMWLGSTKTEPSAVWASKVGEHINFIIGGANVADALYLPIATNGTIQSIRGSSKTMYVMTDLGEHIITSSGTLIHSGDVATDPVSKYGSSVLNSGVVGDQIVFTSPDSKKLLMANFDDNVKNWVASDASLMAHHLAKKGISEFHDMRNPDYQIVCLVSDGSLVQLVYDRNMGLLGWQRSTLEGVVQSLTVTKSINGDILWASVSRSGRTDIIRVEPVDVEDVFLDYWVSRTVKEDSNGFYVDGLEHIASTTAGVLLDGANHPQESVSAAGVLRLRIAGTQAYVGLPYKGKAVTLPEEPADGSSTFSGSKRRNAVVTARLHNSALPLINGSRAPDRSPQMPMGTPPPLISGDVVVSSLGWDDAGAITIEQDLPFNTEIVGIFTKLAVNKK